MAKKQDSFYYENFSECAACACQAAHYLEDALKNFKPEGLSSMLDELHQVEHAADEKKHELSNVLARAFITPIEREDIILLSQSIDEITDKIEDVMLRLYCNNVQTIRPDAIEMGAVLIHCCEEVRKLIDEFADFRRSKKLREYIIHINTMEEQADKLFIDSMRRLHTSTSDPFLPCWTSCTRWSMPPTRKSTSSPTCWPGPSSPPSSGRTSSCSARASTRLPTRLRT